MSRPLFVNVFGIQTRGHKILGADETTELRRPPDLVKLLLNRLFQSLFGLFSSLQYS